MDGSDVKFLSPRMPEESRFEIAQGAVSILGRSLEFRGLGGVRHLSLGQGWSFDLTRGVGGTEQLHLSGVSEDYRVAVEGDVLMLSQLAQRTVVKLQAGRGPACTSMCSEVRQAKALTFCWRRCRPGCCFLRSSMWTAN